MPLFAPLRNTSLDQKNFRPENWTKNDVIFDVFQNLPKRAIFDLKFHSYFVRALPPFRNTSFDLFYPWSLIFDVFQNLPKRAIFDLKFHSYFVRALPPFRNSAPFSQHFFGEFRCCEKGYLRCIPNFNPGIQPIYRKVQNYFRFFIIPRILLGG